MDRRSAMLGALCLGAMASADSLGYMDYSDYVPPAKKHRIRNYKPKRRKSRSKKKARHIG